MLATAVVAIWAIVRRGMLGYAVMPMLVLAITRMPALVLDPIWVHAVRWMQGLALILTLEDV